MIPRANITAWRSHAPWPANEHVAECFQRYMDHGGLTVSRAEFEANLAGKLATAAFREDVRPLISGDVADICPIRIKHTHKIALNCR